MEKSALVVIDMQNGFVNEESPLCVKSARDTIPALQHCIRIARENSVPIIYVKRIYRPDGSDVELCREIAWKEGGRPLSYDTEGPIGHNIVPELAPQPEDYVIVKPRWSAFFQTELDLILRRRGIKDVFLTGTTIPNCIRTSAYDAISLDYNTFIIEDCCSSASPEISKSNLDDMRKVGIMVMKSERFEDMVKLN